MIAVAPGIEADFENLNSFVAAAIREAFYRPELTPEEIAENDRIVGIVERVGRAALDHSHCASFDERTPAGSWGRRRILRRLMIRPTNPN
jgi:hypothetical protein